MRCAIVSSAIVATEGRLDAGHYLGQVNEHRDAVRRSEENLKVAWGRLRRARLGLIKEEHRMTQMIELGKLRPIGG